MGLNNVATQQILILVVIVIAFYLFIFRPQRNKEKKVTQMRKQVEVGDMITTIGGIVGRVVNIKESSDIIIIETSADKNKIQIRRWAINSNDTPVEEVE